MLLRRRCTRCGFSSLCTTTTTTRSLRTVILVVFCLLSITAPCRSGSWAAEFVLVAGIRDAGQRAVVDALRASVSPGITIKTSEVLSDLLVSTLNYGQDPKLCMQAEERAKELVSVLCEEHNSVYIINDKLSVPRWDYNDSVKPSSSRQPEHLSDLNVSTRQELQKLYRAGDGPSLAYPYYSSLLPRLGAEVSTTDLPRLQAIFQHRLRVIAISSPPLHLLPFEKAPSSDLAGQQMRRYEDGVKLMAVQLLSERVLHPARTSGGRSSSQAPVCLQLLQNTVANVEEQSPLPSATTVTAESCMTMLRSPESENTASWLDRLVTSPNDFCQQLADGVARLAPTRNGAFPNFHEAAEAVPDNTLVIEPLYAAMRLLSSVCRASSSAAESTTSASAESAVQKPSAHVASDKLSQALQDVILREPFRTDWKDGMVSLASTPSSSSPTTPRFSTSQPSCSVSHPCPLFIAGTEGSSHHLWGSALGHYKAFRSPSAAAGAYSKLTMARRNIEPWVLSLTKAQRYADALIGAMRRYRKSVQSASNTTTATETIIYDMINAKGGGASASLKLGQMSYPNFASNYRTDRHPILATLDAAARRAGVSWQAVVLVRDPLDQIVSGAKRGFGSWLTQTLGHYHALQLLLADLLTVPPSSLGCFDFDNVDRWCSKLSAFLEHQIDVCQAIPAELTHLQAKREQMNRDGATSSQPLGVRYRFDEIDMPKEEVRNWLLAPVDSYGDMLDALCATIMDLKPSTTS